MIIDLERFISTERPVWNQLEQMLRRLEDEPEIHMNVAEAQQFYELYERTASSLARLTTFFSELDTRRYLETLVARAYGEIHETRTKQRRIAPFTWFSQTLPRTFRRNIGAFYLSLAITIAGCAFGASATAFDPDSRHVTMPFGHDRLRPSERVKQEESEAGNRLTGNKSRFSAMLMTHNIQVSVFTLALGMTWGIGTLLMLFYNGVALGAIAFDYISDGQTRFLLGWIMPHGVIEIPAILIAGQAGIMIAIGLIGWGKRITLSERLREVSRDVVTLSFGFAILLVWAGLIEAFLSQYHQFVVPYDAKIAFGTIQLALLWLYLAKSGR